MKRTLLLSFALFSILICKAQNDTIKEHRIIAGFSTFNGVSYSLKSIGDAPGFSANFMVGYAYQFDENWSAGGTIYAGIIGINDIDDSPFPSYNATVSYAVIMAKNHYSWKTFKNENTSTRLYSGLGIGYYTIIILTTDYIGLTDPRLEPEIGYAYQLDLIGAETTWEWFGAWGELGFGYEGVLKLGVSANF